MVRKLLVMFLIALSSTAYGQPWDCKKDFLDKGDSWGHEKCLMSQNSVSPKTSDTPVKHPDTTFDLELRTSLPKNPIAICLGDARKIKELRGEFFYNIHTGQCHDSCDNIRCQNIHTEIFKNLEQDEIRQTKQKNVDLINRSRVNADVISQALNYVSGNGEDASGWAFWYPVNRQNGNCIFVATSTDITIDLNKGNPNAIQFFTQGNTYITRVDGLPEFRCNGCNGDRVQRAWALIYKECKGTRKAF